MSQRKQSGDVYRLIHKEGTHLASSHDTDGAFRGILFDDDTNRLVAHAEWEKVDESEYGCDYSYDYQENQQEVELSPEEQKFAQLVGEAFAAFTMYVLTEYVAPRVNVGGRTTAVPTMKEKWKIFTDKRKDKRPQKARKNLNYIPMKLLLLMGLFQECSLMDLRKLMKSI